jgi:hypothetical protein
MLFLTRWFGVTRSDSDRNLVDEQACIDEIVAKVLLAQKQAAAKDHCPMHRGTHAKGVAARAQFEVFDVKAGRDSALATRLAQSIFRTPGIYPSVVRFANSDPRVNSDFMPDVRAVSFSMELNRNGAAVPDAGAGRQDFAMQNARTFPINDLPAMVATMKFVTASSPTAGLWSLPFKDKLRMLRTLALVHPQTHQKIKPYQQLSYWSNVPFRHGPADVVRYSLTASSDNPAMRLQRSDPNTLQDELIRHVSEDSKMSCFDFGIQFLDVDRMTYWGKHHDANFWIENASVAWKEAEAPFHTVGRLTLLSKSQFGKEAAEAIYFDVSGNSTPESRPLGGINRGRSYAEVASRKARMRGATDVPSETQNKKNTHV